ncbi:MAG: type IV secretion system protein [Alphaproteobacteria bacterium]|nr:type IV secretion system protein [Alphaproteobacteria bacterium]
MKKYGHRVQLSLLWLLLAVCIFSVLPRSASAAMLETITYAGQGEEEDINCEYDVGKYRAKQWWKKPLDAVLDTSVQVGDSVFDSIGSSVVGLVCVGGGLWLAVFSIKVLGGMVESDPLENLTKVGGLMLRIGIAAALLKNRSFFFGYFLSPIIEAGAGFVDSGNAVSVAGGLSGAASTLKGMAIDIHDTIVPIQAGGDYLQCLSQIHELSVPIIGKYLLTFQDPGAWSAGCAFLVVGWLLIIAFPILLMDAGFRLGITAALCPLFIAAWVFQSTRDYTKKGVNAVLNIAFVFMMIKLSSKFAVELVKGATGLDQLNNGQPDDPTHFVCTFRSYHFGGSDDSCSPADKEHGGITLIFICAVCTAYGIYLMREAANTLANYFSDTSFSNDTAFQAAKGGMTAPINFANTGINMAHDTKSALGKTMVGKAVGKAANKVGAIAAKPFQAAGRAIARPFKKAGNRIKGRAQQLQNKAKSDVKQFSNNVKQRFKDRFSSNNSNSASSQPPTPNAKRDPKTNDWVSTHTNKDGSSVETRMNDQGQRTSVTKRNAAGQVTSRDQFDSKGNQSGHYEATYDSKGQKTSEYQFDKSGSTQRTFKDGQMTREKVKDHAKGTETDTSYNKDGKKIRQSISAGGKKTTMDFDEKEQVSRKETVDRDGTKTTDTFTRGNNGKLVESTTVKENPDGSSERTDWQHDADGKRAAGLKTVTNSKGEEGATLMVDGNGNRPKGMPASAVYNPKDQTWATSYTDKKTGENTRTVMDRNGQRQSVTKTSKDGRITSQTQFKDGNPIITP